MTIRKWIVRIHKWVALVIGIQIVLWIAGGFVMSVIPIEIVRGEHKIAKIKQAEIALEDVIPIQQAAASLGAIGVQSARLDKVLEDPVWRIETTDHSVVVINALNGAVMSPIDGALARQIAETDYAGSGRVTSTEYIDLAPSDQNQSAPIWQVKFDDRDKTTIYVDPENALVTARYSQIWRVYDFFWKLHVMDYDDGADFNHPLLITAAGSAIFVAISGFILLIIKMRRSLIIALKERTQQVKKV